MDTCIDVEDAPAVQAIRRADKGTWQARLLPGTNMPSQKRQADRRNEHRRIYGETSKDEEKNSYHYCSAAMSQTRIVETQTIYQALAFLVENQKCELDMNTQ